jgi:hypothetical protein
VRTHKKRKYVINQLLNKYKVMAVAFFAFEKTNPIGLG